MKNNSDESMSPREETTETSMHSNSNSCSSCHPNTKKRVSWDRIETREFVSVVGDHPLCNDGLPVSLGWQFSDCGPDSLVEASEREQSYSFPRRLSYDERRQRLCRAGLSVEEVKSSEIDLIVRTLKEVWDDEGMQNSSLGEPLAEISMFGDDDLLPVFMDFELGDISDFKWTD
eukprot:scaffold4617_cov106-Cylindrotheca_fusiformis.AAC.4